jgi:hypothetical protein
MTWAKCRRKCTSAKLDEEHVGHALGIHPAEVSPRLHRLKKSLGIRGRSVLICLDDGNVYVSPNLEEPIGSLLDEE